MFVRSYEIICHKSRGNKGPDVGTAQIGNDDDDDDDDNNNNNNNLFNFN